MTQLASQDLHEMVRTSLEAADTFHERNVVAAGRTQDWKHAEWTYRPFRIRIIYTLASRDRKDRDGNPLPEVGIFEWAWADKLNKWHPIQVLNEYRELIDIADERQPKMDALPSGSG